MKDEWSGSRQFSVEAVEAVGNLIAFCSSFLTMFPFIPHRSSIWRRIGDCRKWSRLHLGSRHRIKWEREI